MSEARVVGVDYSTFHIDAVALELAAGDLGAWHRIPLRPRGEKHPPLNVGLAAALKVRPSAWQWLRAGDCVYVEAPLPSPRSTDTIIKLSRIQGAILGTLPRDVVIEEVHPGEWKKAFCGSGNASKEDVMRRAAELGFETEIDDAADAFAIAWTQRELIMDAARNRALVF
jgi:Crossover junction endodeoxyribonuclease RuvC